MDKLIAPSDNPYPGLRPFLGDETHLFFGRDEQRVELLRRLRLSRFLAIIGTSGSGKSSLVRAGLLPGLHGGFMAGRGGYWRVADLRPGTDPIGNLARALDQPEVLHDDADGERGPSYTETTLRRSAQGLVEAVREARLPAADRLLVLVDQFEELFRGLEARDSANARDDASAFVKLLLAASGQAELNIYVVITMRSDFLGDCARFRGLPEAINGGQYLIPRLTRDQIAEAVTGPAAVMGAALSSALVNRLLNDVGDNPDQLPILQHALMRTWDEWARRGCPDGTLALDHYEAPAVGGMAQALNRHADEVLASLAEGQTPVQAARRLLIAERLFQALTDTHTAGREVRRLARVGDVALEAGASVDEVLAVAEVFRQPRNAFLMPPAGEPVTPESDLDISHESLMRHWRTLQGWQQAEAASANLYLRLADTAARHGRGGADLWDETDLGETWDWREARQPSAGWARRYGGNFSQAMDFLDDSKAAVLTRLQARRRNRRVIVTLVALVLSVLVVSTLGWVADDLAQIRERADKASSIQHMLAKTPAMRSLVDLRNLKDGAALVPGCADALAMQRETAQADADEAAEAAEAADTTARAEPAEAADPAAADPPDTPRARSAVAEDRAQSTWGEHWLPVYRAVCQETVTLDNNEPLLLKLVEALNRGDIGQADHLVHTEPGQFAIPAHQLMDDLARMQDDQMRDERRRLVALRSTTGGSAAAAPRPAGRLFGAAQETPFLHPVHRHIAARLQGPATPSHPEDSEQVAAENWLLDRYAKQLTRGKGSPEELTHWALEPPGDGPCANASSPLFSWDISAFYIGMCETANQPESRLAGLRAALREALMSYWMELLVLLTWPLWRLRRWWQRRQGVAIASSPHPLRRALAMVFDAMTAVGILAALFLLGLALSSVLPPKWGYWLEDTLFIAGILLALFYTLLCDTLRWRYCRSVGKIAFDLRPLRDSSLPRGRITPGTSARRNALMLGWLLVLLVAAMAASEDLADPLVRAGYYLTALALTLAPNLLMRGRSWPDRWSKTTLVDADSAESLAAELPPRYCPAAPDGTPVTGPAPPRPAAARA